MAFIKSKKQIKSVDKDAAKKKPLYIVGRNLNSYSHYGNQYGGSSKKLKIELQNNLAILFLEIYPKELKLVYQRDICMSLFIKHYHNSQNMSLFRIKMTSFILHMLLSNIANLSR